MYKIIYQKSNGQIIERIRNTLPIHTIGEETSMGWLILNIQYHFKNDYYDLRDYQLLVRKHSKSNRTIFKINKFIKKYASWFIIILLMPFIII